MTRDLLGFLREILVAPISRSAVALGKALGGATQAMLQGVMLLVLAPVLGIQLTVVSVLEAVLLLFALAFGLTSFGVAVSARMKSMQGFQTVTGCHHRRSTSCRPSPSVRGQCPTRSTC